MTETLDIRERCRREIVELHRFFQDWFRGAVPATAEAFSRFSQVLHADFHIVTPQGEVLEREAILERVRKGHGREKDSQPPFRIEVRNVRRAASLNEAWICTYEEWQGHGDDMRGRLSSVLLVARPQTPHGLGWVHVHETALPTESRP